MPTVRLDFFLNSRTRLTEQERALMTAMLADLVNMVADEFVSTLADTEPANDDGGHLLDRLWASGLLDIPHLVALLLRRAEEERIAAGIRAAWPSGKARFLQSLVSDEDSDVSAAAMALILARGRRRDRFDGPRLIFDDISAEAAVALVTAIAAAFRADLVARLGDPEADERLSGGARALLSRHDEASRLEAKLFDLVHALDGTGRLDERLIRSVLEEGDVSLLAEALARRSGIGFDSAWEHLTGGGGRLALLLRMAGLTRELAGEIIASAAGVVGSDAEMEIQAFDGLSDGEVDRSRKWLRLDPAYRAAIGAMGKDDGERTV
ncbi:MAG TPA: DUF2336 domain-containing protein [Sphingomicrobium sp.]|nr:DUF2336 domain-containing protein [Sphingomicrobium sp.]